MFSNFDAANIRQFNGLFDKGKDFVCPSDHWLDALNMVFTLGGAETRKGFDKIFTVGTIKRKVLYKRVGEATRYIILDGSGNFYDSTNLAVVLKNIPTATDFSAINFYNRIYISPHNGQTGLAGEFVYVYDGTTFRKAAGATPSGTLIAANSSIAGNVESGTHVFAVVFETATGFLSKLGPTVFASVVAGGTKKVDLSGIPTGPSYVTKRHIVATKAIQTYNGNQAGQEYFFIPTGVINNNVDTTATVNFYDADLSSDANYLFDVLTEIPACLVLSSYKDRMVCGNFNTDKSLLRLSIATEPEVFDDTAGIITVDPTEAGYVSNLVELRDLLGITKSPFRTYITQDNGDDPNTWEKPISIDKGIGTEVHGISTILDTSAAHADKFLIADRGGLTLYNGTFVQPRLSFKIGDIWRRINKNFFYTVQVAYDPTNEFIYVAVPLDAATSPSHILFADASEGMQFDKIKWSIWQFPWSPTSILLDVINGEPVLHVSGNHVYRYNNSRTNDENTAILSFAKFPLVPEESGGVINHIVGYSTRITGSGSVNVIARGEDDANQQNPPNFVLSASPGGEIARLMNFVGERMSLEFRLSSINEYMSINALRVYYTRLWDTHPE